MMNDMSKQIHAQIDEMHSRKFFFGKKSLVQVNPSS